MMMREILFKAKRIDNGEWVEGFYECDPDLDHHYIVGFEYYTSENGLEREIFSHDVNKETISQYTGLTDKNGNKIWENDVLEWEFANIPSDYYECVWLEDECAFAFKNGNDYTNPVDCYDEYSDHFCMKVIGNIFDNAELVKGSEQNG